MSKRLDISEDEVTGLLAEIEELRPSRSPYAKHFTAEQDKVILAARGPGVKNPVRWDDLVRWWTDRYGRINQDTLRRRLRELEVVHNAGSSD